MVLKILKENSNIRDIELKLKNNDMISKVFNSLTNNFMIKTLRLLANGQANKDVIETATKFMSHRVACDVQLNTKIKHLASTRKRLSEFYYPDESSMQDIILL